MLGLSLAFVLSLAAPPVMAQSVEDAWTAYDAGDYGYALDLFGRLADEGDPDALFGLGLMHHGGAGVPRDEALGAELIGRAAEAGHVAAQDTLGYYYDFGLGLPQDKALAEYWYGRAVDGGSINAMNNLAYSWVDRGANLDQALAMLREVVEIEPEAPAYLDSLGWLFYRLGHYAEAVPPLCDAARRDPGHPEVQAHLGDAYWRVGRREDAAFQWKRALELAEDPIQLSENGMDFLRGVGAQSWIAAMGDRIQRGLVDPASPAGQPPQLDNPYLPQDEECEQPVS